jgi:hypothetical protein
MLLGLGLGLGVRCDRDARLNVIVRRILPEVPGRASSVFSTVSCRLCLLESVLSSLSTCIAIVEPARCCTDSKGRLP